MNSTEKVVMAVVAMVAVASVAIAVYYAFFHKCNSTKKNCPTQIQTIAMKVLTSGKFLKADGTLTNNISEATFFDVSPDGSVSPAIEGMKWTATTVDNVSVLQTVDQQLGSIIMDVSKSPVGAKPQSVMAGLHDADCQLAFTHATGLLPNPRN